MRISRVQIANFRNFHVFDVAFAKNVVVVGENKIGKTNLLLALRLILDPTLPDSARQLRDEDFWDGLYRPLTGSDKITISVDLTDFENNKNQVALLADHLIGHSPMTARLTYAFQAIDLEAGKPTKESDYEFILYGGGRPDNYLGYDIRRGLPLDLLPALRDAEGDVASWRRSPLRPLLDAAAARIDRDDLATLADGISKATGLVVQHGELRALIEAINNRVQNMVGPSHAIETTLGFSPTNPERLLRALRLYIDSGRRDLGLASLGSANVLYLALKALELDQSVAEGQRHHTFLAIEEPEAHLHPHLQRLVYREFLRSQAGGKAETPVTVLLTTHSPHIASVAPLESIVLLRRSTDGQSTEAVSTVELEIDSAVVADLERYLDVTRAEMLFAKGVILVEGESERYLIPAIAKAKGVDFDKLGISVCAIAGTNFDPYVTLLGDRGLRLPVSVMTDGDPDVRGTKRGEARILGLLHSIAQPKDLLGLSTQQQLKVANQRGFFVGDHTFEVDFFRSGAVPEICQTLRELSSGPTAAARASSWQTDPAGLDSAKFLKDVEAIGKGRFAQRLSTRIASGHCPAYVNGAIEYVRTRCS
jgi:putative ATP-dependent endonuclease of OLD family